MKLLLYCTKGNKHTCLEYADNPNKNDKGKYCITSGYPYINGKIVAECDYEMEEICYNFFQTYCTWYCGQPELLKKSCLDFKQMRNYLGTEKFYCGYAIYIENLKIFDKPIELNEYCNLKCSKCDSIKAPQNMMYIYKDNIKYVLISIHPEHLCKILNGEKTIEVRKKVLKCM